MTDYGTLKLSNGHLAVRNGRLAKGARTPACVATSCKLCAGATGYWRDIVIAGITDSYEACVDYGSPPFEIVNTVDIPTEGPNGTFRLGFNVSVPDKFYTYADHQLADRRLIQDDLFQSAELEEPAYCEWIGSIPCTGQVLVYIDPSTDCSGAYHIHRHIETLYLRLRLQHDFTNWELLGRYDGHYHDGYGDPVSMTGILSFCYGLVDGGDLEEIEFTGITPLGADAAMFDGISATATITVNDAGDPIVQEDLAQHAPDTVLFQGDLF